MIFKSFLSYVNAVAMRLLDFSPPFKAAAHLDANRTDELRWVKQAVNPRTLSSRPLFGQVP